MQIILTANVASSLYWLGRYLQRVESTLQKMLEAYDLIIDVDSEAGSTLYKHFGIDIHYTGAMDFLNEAILGEHHANLVNVITNARENAIISRTNIDTNAFGEIMELYALFQRAQKSSETIDYKFIDTVQSLISEIWGATVKREHQIEGDVFFRLGKLVEELDFNCRFGSDEKTNTLIVDKIQTIIEIIDAHHCLNDQELTLVASDPYKIFTIITQKINTFIVL